MKRRGSKRQYDVALSFAGEDRTYVDGVAKKLKSLKINVFYDLYEQPHLWGKDLYQHLDRVYRLLSRYTIVFISEHYKKKNWTKHELKSAQARAFEENHAYLLPVLLDDTKIAGILPTVGYLDGRKSDPKEIALMMAKKLRG